ncbi:hypothetical protein JOE21_003616 [Desmospora profundinema]|uniref:Uncharacterized protein n=1 Tax=Desmospora profundinema TaxID=1571184 RepID=A0ABU1IS35_9BACL|nr:hypothetical protein [Desmospora profundinema]
MDLAIDFLLVVYVPTLAFIKALLLHRHLS